MSSQLPPKDILNITEKPTPNVAYRVADLCQLRLTGPPLKRDQHITLNAHHEFV
jgi:hypothetical protein